MSGKLDCDKKSLNDETMTEAQADAAARACIASVKQPFSAYGTASAARDIEQVRLALGYDKINLWGASYGTRLAQAYARLPGPGALADPGRRGRPRPGDSGRWDATARPRSTWCLPSARPTRPATPPSPTCAASLPPSARGGHRRQARPARPAHGAPGQARHDLGPLPRHRPQHPVQRARCAPPALPDPQRLPGPLGTVRGAPQRHHRLFGRRPRGPAAAPGRGVRRRRAAHDPGPAGRRRLAAHAAALDPDRRHVRDGQCGAGAAGRAHPRSPSRC
ncbi:alpha/beta fold hydrolase [Massilia sp. H-1]|nr:alpha/beta fold hydrolase [Massilia sp. H-1]